MTTEKLTRLARRLAWLLCAGAVLLVGLSLDARPPRLGPEVARAAPPAAAGKAGRADGYDLSSLEIFRQVVVFIKDNYVDPARIHPKAMFLAALEAVEKNTAEVIVEGSAKDGTVEVTCGNDRRTFDFSDVTSIWMIPHRIRPVFEFIQAHLTPSEDRHDIEYAAINGMLSTLDPHSWLLNPASYREMRLQTKGEFGGLGFVIAMDDEKLTVKKVLHDTPAFRAGIVKGDHITRIEDESTINMDLNDAVTLLRGKPGTQVRIWIQRGKAREKLYRLTRDLISIESVTSQLLAGGVGYVHLSSFAGTTSRDLEEAISAMKAKNGGHLAGLVMDLRSNPGGLLEQAYQVADQFIDKGTIVTTAGMSDKLREPKEAHDDGDDREFPLAVLVNSESASASEIVAGALKNLDRAPIIGRQTFGKGSVQVLYDLKEPVSGKAAALKLTIAQYLTPGDQSIQEIGVTPDIQLLPARVTKNRIDLFAPPRLMRETDLDRHFGAGFTPQDAPDQKLKLPPSAETLRYLAEAKKADRAASGGGEGGRDLKDVMEDDNDSDSYADAEPDDDHVADDFQVEFARELLLAAPKTDRLGLLEAARPFLEKSQAQEKARIEKALATLGVDWSQTKKPAGRPVAKVEFTATPARAVAGERLTLQAQVTNVGTAPFERLRAWTRCDAARKQFQGLCRVLDRREFIFGRVGPGQKRAWSTSFKVPNELPSVREELSLVFQDAFGEAPAPQAVSVEAVEARRPVFAYSYQVLSPDNLAEPGETIEVEVSAKNVGAGAAKAAYVSLQNAGDENVFMKKGRVGLGPLKPGQTRTATLSMELKKGLDPTRGVPLKLEIGDRDLWQFTDDKLALPAAARPPARSETQGLARLGKDELLLSAPQAGSPPIALARAGSRLPVVARLGSYDRIEWADGRYGYLPAGAATTVSGHLPARFTSVAEPVMFREPPSIRFSQLDTSKAPVVVDQDHFKLTGTATDPAGLIDVRVFVDDQKVFFHTASGTGGARTGRQPKMPFQASFALKPGNNTVFVVAREDEELSASRTLVIHRRSGALAQRKPETTGADKPQ